MPAVPNGNSIKREALTMSNDFAVFRLADIILMKAEAQFRNGDVSDALTTINQKINGVSIRGRAGLPDFTAAEMNLDGLLKERACELSWEGWRRNDMIRFGHFPMPGFLKNWYQETLGFFTRYLRLNWIRILTSFKTQDINKVNLFSAPAIYNFRVCLKCNKIPVVSLFNHSLKIF